jgi:hypothetical protein
MNGQMFVEGPFLGSYGHQCIKVLDNSGMFYIRSYDDLVRADVCYIEPIIKELRKLGLPIDNQVKLESFLAYMIEVGIKKNKSRKFGNLFKLSDLRFFATSYILGFCDGREVKDHENS